MSTILPVKAGLALAITLGILYAACSVFYAVLPQFAMGMQMASFHEAGTMGVNMGPSAFLYGLVAVLIAGYAIGALFAFSYNRLTHA